ncbi:hypothetical protein Fluta_0938 [Fluviicola taffensis DSM 16823]|uniref:Uncharacterized protein n=1 Tax=Fluviicola taffensis (strain DSM 16823 / NCIMB 13979 / RW262) TaxID=755732 RepID=F2IK40_FLUTR|nr:hypothetical protein Fluta_0938 [Fluviicola taffensis DSM 16823]
MAALTFADIKSDELSQIIFALTFVMIWSSKTSFFLLIFVRH